MSETAAPQTSFADLVNAELQAGRGKATKLGQILRQTGVITSDNALGEILTLQALSKSRNDSPAVREALERIHAVEEKETELNAGNAVQRFFKGLRASRKTLAKELEDAHEALESAFITYLREKEAHFSEHASEAATQNDTPQVEHYRQRAQEMKELADFHARHETYTDSDGKEHPTYLYYLDKKYPQVVFADLVSMSDVAAKMELMGSSKEAFDFANGVQIAARTAALDKTFDPLATLPEGAAPTIAQVGMVAGKLSKLAQLPIEKISSKTTVADHYKRLYAAQALFCGASHQTLNLPAAETLSTAAQTGYQTWAFSELNQLSSTLAHASLARVLHEGMPRFEMGEDVRDRVHHLIGVHKAENGETVAVQGSMAGMLEEYNTRNGRRFTSPEQAEEALKEVARQSAASIVGVIVFSAVGGDLAKVTPESIKALLANPGDEATKKRLSRVSDFLEYFHIELGDIAAEVVKDFGVVAQEIAKQPQPGQNAPESTAGQHETAATDGKILNLTEELAMKGAATNKSAA